jgi:hypothetical protein
MPFSSDKKLLGYILSYFRAAMWKKVKAVGGFVG